MPEKKAAPATTLALFDIDGTLIRRAGPHHRLALVDAVRAVAGVETTTDHIPLQGMLDPDILSLMMRRAGLKPAAIRRMMPEVVERAQTLYARRCPSLENKVCPGARMLLWRLFRRGVPTGLVTGNLTRIGWKKMERAGLRRYFRFGAFSEHARDRAGLLRLAVRTATAAGWIARGARVTLVGDHPNDIRAAQANGARSVAVATGLSSAEELAEHKPDVLLPDLRAIDLETLFGFEK
ncbi:MAG: HAD hydrolase-like protein [Acidobacteria bacterium]|nr:HAD hydrolase-like protein [Acidobacteriota bacterium]